MQSNPALATLLTEKLSFYLAHLEKRIYSRKQNMDCRPIFVKEEAEDIKYIGSSPSCNEDDPLSRY
jgi:hypothetical protein